MYIDKILQDATSKECGLHSGNVVSSAAEQGAQEAQQDLWPTGAVEPLDHEELERLADGQRTKDTLIVLYAPWCQYSQVRPILHVHAKFVAKILSAVQKPLPWWQAKDDPSMKKFASLYRHMEGDCGIRDCGTMSSH